MSMAQSAWGQNSSLQNGLSERLEALVQESKEKGIPFLLDLGRHWSGDLLAENFIENDFEYGRWFFECLAGILKKTGHSAKIRFTDLKNKDFFEKNSFGPWEGHFEGASLSFLDPQVLESTFILDILDLLSLIQTSRTFKELSQSSSKDGKWPICLWGDVEQVGHHWIDRGQSLSEIFEVAAGGGPRTQYILINGPIGEIYSWSEVKNKELSSWDTPIRTIHFFSQQVKDSFSKVWNEFFREESCQRCLPCVFARKSMVDSENVKDLKNFAPFQCHYPTLYRKIDTFQKHLQVPLNEDKR